VHEAEVSNPKARIVHLIQSDEITTYIRLGSQRTWLKPMLHSVARRGLEVDAIRIAVSRAVADAVGRDRIHRIINPGIDARYIQSASQATPARRERRHDHPEKLTVGFFAQSGRAKGTAVAIEGLARFADLETVRFVAFDRGGPLLPTFVERFSVIQGDRAMDPMAFYNTCDIFVFPALVEGFGLPPLEAMACGLPVVTTRVGGNAEVVTSDRLGTLVPFGDATALASAVAAALERSWDRPAIVAHAAGHGWDARIREVLAEWDALLGAHAKSATPAPVQPIGAGPGDRNAI